MVNIQRFKLDIKKPTSPQLRVVNGDTANTFVITVQDDGNSVTLDTTLHKIIAVFTRADGQVYTQDADTGVSFTSGGVVTIIVRPASFRTGTNRVCLQIYKRENSSATEYPLLCTTSEAKFSARAQAIPDSGAPNAPSQLPMLEGLIEDAQEAISDCEDATDAANDAADAANDAADAANAAAEALNTMLDNIDDEPTQSSNHLVKSGGVYSFVTDKVQEAADDVRAQIPEGASSATAEKPKMDGTAYAGVSAKWARADHVHPHDTSKQDVLTFDVDPTQNSNNPVKSGGVWYALEQKQDILVLDNAPTQGSDHYVNSGGIYTAIDAAACVVLHITGTEEVQGTGGKTYRKVTFASGETDKIFQLRNTRDMIVRLPVWDVANDVVETLRIHEVIESETLTIVRFETGLHPIKPNDSVQDKTVGGIEAYEVGVFYNNGAFHSAVATHFTGSL